MKILGICGSHRKNSASEYLLNVTLEICKQAGFETQLITLADKKIEACDACDYCKTAKACHIKDDMQTLYKKLIQADGVVIASPTYFASVSGKLKDFMDRTLVLRRDNFKLRNKVGGAIAVGASRNGGQEFVCMQIHNWMLLHEMIPVTDKETAHFGGIVWCPRGSKPEEDKIGIQTCENLGKRVCEVLNLIKK